jgi:DNA-binding transcriptional LysR family regulator
MSAVSGTLIVNDDDLLIVAAREGLGIAFTFEGLAQPDLTGGTLVRVLEDWCPVFPGFSIYYPSKRQLRPAVRAFVDFFQRHGGHSNS